MDLLITGAAGFIGFHLAKLRLAQGDKVVGVDNLNDYYDVGLKKARLSQLQIFDNFTFYPTDIADSKALHAIFKRYKPQRVINLAAQAGVRYSLVNPDAYVQSNLVGFSNLIEACRYYEIEHLVYASTSSVYGETSKQPCSEEAPADHPLSLYAATKKANELIAHTYSHLYQLPTTGLRFFTVYGPWGRPDMAFFSFTKDILAGKPIQIYNHGKMQRDFTYIDDIVAGISLAIDKVAAAASKAPYKIYNLGYGQPVNLLDYIAALESALGKKAIKTFLPLQAGDVLITHASTKRFCQALGFKPQVSYEEGIAHFVRWYLSFYSIAKSVA